MTHATAQERGPEMFDFNGLRAKAQDLLAQHSDTVKHGITKAGGLVGGKVGHHKVDPIEDELRGMVDKAAGRNGRDGQSGQSQPPVTPTTPAV